MRENLLNSLSSHQDAHFPPAFPSLMSASLGTALGMDWSRWNSSADSRHRIFPTAGREGLGGKNRSKTSALRHAPIRISENSVLLWHRYTGTTILTQGQWKLEVCWATMHDTFDRFAPAFSANSCFIYILAVYLRPPSHCALFNRSNLSMVEFLLDEASLCTGSLHKFHGRGWLDQSQPSTIWFICTLYMLHIFTHHLKTSYDIFKRFTSFYMISF